MGSPGHVSEVGQLPWRYSILMTGQRMASPRTEPYSSTQEVPLMCRVGVLPSVAPCPC